jgi:hypothetical protein
MVVTEIKIKTKKGNKHKSIRKEEAIKEKSEMSVTFL